jgi:hypothetical protein
MHKTDTFSLLCLCGWLIKWPRKAHFARYWSDMPAMWRPLPRTLQLTALSPEQTPRSEVQVNHSPHADQTSP